MINLEQCINCISLTKVVSDGMHLICESDVATSYYYVWKDQEQLEAFARLFCNDDNSPAEEQVESVKEAMEDGMEKGTLASILINEETGSPLLFQEFEETLVDRFGSVQSLISAICVGSSSNLDAYGEQEPVSITKDEASIISDVVYDNDILSALDKAATNTITQELEETVQEVVEEPEREIILEEPVLVDDVLIETGIKRESEFEQVVNYFSTITDDRIRRKVISTVASSLLKDSTPDLVVNTLYNEIVYAFTLAHGKDESATEQFLESFMREFNL